DYAHVGAAVAGGEVGTSGPRIGEVVPQGQRERAAARRCRPRSASAARTRARMIVASAARSAWSTARGSLSVARPLVVGILNLTPDSFYDGGRYAAPAAALERAAQLIADGAAVIDIGAESTR